MLIAKLLSLVAALLMVATPSIACMCRRLSQVQARDAATVIFTGTVVADGQQVRFRVDRVYKGTVRRTLVVLDPIDTSCGFGFASDRAYLVYATEVGRALTTDNCTRNRPIEEAEGDLLFLGRGSRPRS